MIKLVAFDYNGTILNDIKIMHICIVTTITEFGKTGPYEKLKFENWRKEFDLPYDNFYQNFGIVINQNIHAAFHKIYNMFKTPRLFKNFKWALSEIQKTNLKTIIISGTTNEKSFYQTIRKKKLNFDKIYLNCKNKIVAFKQVVKDFNIQPNEMAYVCDMKYDINTARTAGVLSIYYLKGLTGVYGLEAKPDYCFNDYRQLPEIIHKIN